MSLFRFWIRVVTSLVGRWSHFIGVLISVLVSIERTAMLQVDALSVVTPWWVLQILFLLFFRFSVYPLNSPLFISLDRRRMSYSLLLMWIRLICYLCTFNRLQSFNDVKPHMTPGWQQKLPRFVNRLEEVLYKNAPSKVCVRNTANWVRRDSAYLPRSLLIRFSMQSISNASYIILWNPP